MEYLGIFFFHYICVTQNIVLWNMLFVQVNVSLVKVLITNMEVEAIVLQSRCQTVSQ